MWHAVAPWHGWHCCQKWFSEYPSLPNRIQKHRTIQERHMLVKPVRIPSTKSFHQCPLASTELWQQKNISWPGTFWNPLEPSTTPESCPKPAHLSRDPVAFSCWGKTRSCRAMKHAGARAAKDLIQSPRCTIGCAIFHPDPLTVSLICVGIQEEILPKTSRQLILLTL